MEEFYKVIYTTLKETGLPVFHEEPERGTPRPFITFKVDERSRTDNPKLLSAAIVIEDSSVSGENAESISKYIDSLFDRKVMQTESYKIRFLRQARNNLGDPEPLITRIELDYQLRAFKK